MVFKKRSKTLENHHPFTPFPPFAPPFGTRGSTPHLRRRSRRIRSGRCRPRCAAGSPPAFPPLLRSVSARQPAGPHGPWETPAEIRYGRRTGWARNDPCRGFDKDTPNPRFNEELHAKVCNNVRQQSPGKYIHRTIVQSYVPPAHLVGDHRVHSVPQVSPAARRVHQTLQLQEFFAPEVPGVFPREVFPPPRESRCRKVPAPVG